MKLRDYIYQRDQGVCVYCEDAIGQALEHVIPRSRGGPHIRENVVLSCTSCNSRKNDKIIDQYTVKAFVHLTRVGESLQWVDEWLDEYRPEPELDDYEPIPRYAPAIKDPRIAPNIQAQIRHAEQELARCLANLERVRKLALKRQK